MEHFELQFEEPVVCFLMMSIYS